MGCSSAGEDDVATSDESALSASEVAGTWALDAASVVTYPGVPVFEELRLYKPTSWGSLTFRGRLRGHANEVHGDYTNTGSGAAEEIRLQWVEDSLGGALDVGIHVSGATRTLRSSTYGTMNYEMTPVAVPALPPLPPGTADPFDASSCTGAALTVAQARPYFAPGRDTTQFAHFDVRERTRTCSSGACGPWTIEESSDFSGRGDLELRIAAGYFGAAPVVSLQIVPYDDQGEQRGSPCGTIGAAHCRDYTTTLTATCFRATKNGSETTPTGETIETERVAFANVPAPPSAPSSPVLPEPEAFDPSSCPSSLSEATALGMLRQGGGAPISLGSYEVLARHRDCNQVTGCGPWIYEDPAANPRSHGTAMLRLKNLGPNWQYPYVTVTPSAYPSQSGSCGSLDGSMSCDSSSLSTGPNYDDVSVGTGCFRAASHFSSMNSAGTTTTAEQALLSHY